MLVFSDTFTVGADVDPASYPGTPDYSYLLGAVNDAQIPAANDRVEIVVTSSDVVLRLLNAACPTGDQEILADCRVEGGFYQGYVAARCHATVDDCYVGEMDLTTANEVQIYRRDTGSGFTLLASADRGFVDTSGTHSYRLRATGTNPVSLTFQVDATAALGFDDSDALRKQSGRNGLGGVNGVARTGWVDNLTIDDLVASSEPIYTQNRSSVPPNIRIAGGI